MNARLCKCIAAFGAAAACSGCAGLMTVVDAGPDPSERILTSEERVAQERHLEEFRRQLEEDLRHE